MRSMNDANFAAIKNSVVIPRDFITFKVTRKDNGAAFEYGFWSGSDNVSAQVTNPQTGRAEARNFEGAGTLIQISDLNMQIGLQVQAINVNLSQVKPSVQNFIHTYHFKQGIIEIFRGWLDPDSRQLVGPAECRFFGYINNLQENIPKSGDTGNVDLSCNSHSQEITRFNTSTRSDADQQVWFPGDKFCQDTTVVGTIEYFWGQEQQAIPTTGVRRIGLNFNTRANV